jgi:hypothetical protein
MDAGAGEGSLLHASHVSVAFMSLRKVLYALAVAGFVIPNAMVIAFIVDHGFAVGLYFTNWVDRLSSAQLLVDLCICAAAFLAWSSVDGPRSGVGRWWYVFPATFLVGLCFAIPLYLLMREDARQATAA